GAENAVVHDDICDALYLATIPYKPRQAHRVVCHLAHLAGSSRAPADARVPELSCDVVESGGGLRLPVQPTLQSVAGTAFTTYAAVRPSQPEGFTAGRFRVTTTQTGVM